MLLGDGETWSRQKVDFSGLPEMVRTFLQVAAGAADIPVTRLLGQSPAGISATGESDTRNYYDMISSRQEIDLRPKLERLDDLVLRSAGLDPAALSFEFRPLWQMDASASAAIALQKAQATQIYASLNLWPASVTAKLVEAQLAEDGTYPGAEAIFASEADRQTADAFPFRSGFDPNQPRDPDGRWTEQGAAGFRAPDDRPILISDPEETKRELEEGLAGGSGPLDDPVPPRGEDPIVSLVPRLASHGPLERVPSPAIALPVAPRTPAATAKPAAPVGPTGRPSVSEPSGAPLGVPTPPTTLQSIEVPPGLTLKARGETIKQRADDYVEEVRKAIGFDPAPPKNKLGDTRPDGLGEEYPTGFEIALEVKYLSPSEKKLRDPNRDIPFINQKDVEQAGKYLDEFKGGLLWVTNNKELSDKYDKLFKGNGLSGFRVVYIPSEEE